MAKDENIGKIINLNKNIKLDKKNNKIIALLMDNARITLSEIAKEVELSKSNIARRIKRLENENLITGYHAFIDVSKLGVNSSILLIKTKLTTKEKEDYIKKISNIKEVYSIAELTGEFDLIIGLYYTSKKQKEGALDSILDEELLKDYELSEIKTYFPRLNYTKEIFYNGKTPEIDFKEDKMGFDQIDLKILKALSTNCRESIVNLTEKLKLSREIINYRIKKLISSKAIAKFQPTINYYMLESEFYFMRFKLLKPSIKEKLIEYISTTLRANTIIESSSSYQIMAFLQFKSHNEFKEFEENLFKKFPQEIFDYSFEIAKSQYKLNWFPEIEFNF